MSIHKINIDAIAAGAGALLLDWPNEPRRPTVPARAHAVMWEDDYWRGVDMAREAIVQAFGWSGWTEPSACLWTERATIFMVARRMTHGQVEEILQEGANLDVVDVIEAALLGIVETGDPEHRTEAPRSCDDEVAADAWAEA